MPARLRPGSCCRSALPPRRFVPFPPPERVLSFFNTHTGERLTHRVLLVAARISRTRCSRSIPAARLPRQRSQADRSAPARSAVRIERHARHRSAVPRDLGLSLAADQRHAAGARRARTAASLRHSLHMVGRRSTSACPAWTLEHLRDAAKCAQDRRRRLLPESNFVHVDTGRVRFW